MNDSLLVGATQNSAVRLSEATPSNIVGLYTTEIRNCVCIVFMGDNGRISLSHLDPTVDVQNLRREIDFVRNGTQSINKIVLVTNHELKDAEWITKIKNFLTRYFISEAKMPFAIFRDLIKECSAVNLAFYINRSGNELTGDIICDSVSKGRHAINMLNHTLGDSGIDVQYNGTEWTTAPSLHGKAREIITKFKLTVDSNRNMENASLLDFCFSLGGNKQAMSSNLISLADYSALYLQYHDQIASLTRAQISLQKQNVQESNNPERSAVAAISSK
jgi:hypothetical protein